MNAKRTDKIATGVLYALSGIIVAILAFLLIYILVRGLPFVSWEFLTTPSNPLTGGGIAVQLFNSVYLLVVTLIISIPLSLGAGIYLSEYANQKHWLLVQFAQRLRSYHHSLQSLWVSSVCYSS